MKVGFAKDGRSPRSTCSSLARTVRTSSGRHRADRPHRVAAVSAAGDAVAGDLRADQHAAAPRAEPAGRHAGHHADGAGPGEGRAQARHRSSRDSPDQRAGRQGEVRSGESARPARVRDERVHQGGARSGRRDVQLGRAQGAERQAQRLEGARRRRRDEHVRRRLDGIRRPLRHQAGRPDVHPDRRRQPRHRVVQRHAPRGRRDDGHAVGEGARSPGATRARTCRGRCVSGGSQTTHAHDARGARRATDAIKKPQEIAAKSLGGKPEDYVVANERVCARAAAAA